MKGSAATTAIAWEGTAAPRTEPPKEPVLDAVWQASARGAGRRLRWRFAAATGNTSGRPFRAPRAEERASGSLRRPSLTTLAGGGCATGLSGDEEDPRSALEHVRVQAGGGLGGQLGAAHARHAKPDHLGELLGGVPGGVAAGGVARVVGARSGGARVRALVRARLRRRHAGALAGDRVAGGAPARFFDG